MLKEFLKIWGIILVVMLGIVVFVLSLIWVGAHIGIVGVLIEGSIVLSGIIALAIAIDINR